MRTNHDLLPGALMRLFQGPTPTRLSRASLLILLIASLAAGCGDDKKNDQSQNHDPYEDAHGDDSGGDPVDTDQEDTKEEDADQGDTTPDPDGFYIAGLSAPVKVQFDESGVLHLDCQTNRDCYLAQGYFHADTRFFEMDLIRRQARGQLTELIGQAALSTDIQYRRLNTTTDGTPLEQAYLEKVNDSTREMLDAYASGVNAWIENMREDKQGAKLTEEYKDPFMQGAPIREWEPEDTIALYLQLAYQLGETATEDLFRGEMAATLTPEMAADLFTVKPAMESNILQASGASAPHHLTHPSGAGSETSATFPGDYFSHVESLRRVHERLKPARALMARAHQNIAANPSMVFGPKDGQDGSNNWALSPDLTKNGTALLANDPHLSLNAPAIWYMVELDSKTNGQGDLHAVGASIPSVPGVIIGHNEHISWGVTTARMDLADAYIEELNDDGSAVIFNGQEVPIVTKEFTFNIKGGSPKTETFEYVPHHGPIIEKDVDNKIAISLKWVLQEPGSDLDFIQDLLRAESTQEGMDSLAPVRAINQNWVFTDREGNIGWNPKVAIPNRPWADLNTPNWLPLPGDGSAEWDGYLDDDQSPRMYNPPAGFIATANNDMDGSYTDGDATNDGHPPWQTVPAEGYRHKRIVDLIEAGGDEHTAETMREIQADTHILHAEKILPRILAFTNANEHLLSEKTSKYVKALRDWEYTCPTGLDGSDPKDAAKSSDPDETRESIGCSAFHVLLPYLTRAIFDDEVNLNPPPGQDRNFDVLANWAQFQSALAYLFDAPEELHHGEDYFDDVRTSDTTEVRATILLAQLEYAANKIDEVFAAATNTSPEDLTPDDWRWGRIHTVTFKSLLSVGSFTLVSVGPYANDGGYGSVDVANPVGSEGIFKGKFEHPHGASVRIIMEAGEDGVSGTFQLPGGQSHHRDSPYFNSLVDDWLSNTPRPMWFNRDDVDANAVETIEAQPLP